MDKVRNFQEKATVFRSLLKKYTSDAADAESLFGQLEPLFMMVDIGEITPLHRYEFNMALGKEPEFYERHQDVFSAESDFMSALED